MTARGQSPAGCRAPGPRRTPSRQRVLVGEPHAPADLHGCPETTSECARAAAAFARTAATLPPSSQAAADKGLGTAQGSECCPGQAVPDRLEGADRADQLNPRPPTCSLAIPQSGPGSADQLARQCPRGQRRPLRTSSPSPARHPRTRGRPPRRAQPAAGWMPPIRVPCRTVGSDLDDAARHVEPPPPRPEPAGRASSCTSAPGCSSTVFSGFAETIRVKGSRPSAAQATPSRAAVDASCWAWCSNSMLVAVVASSAVLRPTRALGVRTAMSARRCGRDERPQRGPRQVNRLCVHRLCYP